TELTTTSEEIDNLIEDLRRFLEAISPVIQAPKELIEALHKLGFRVPGWIVESDLQPTDPKAKSPQS
ncbi:MAG TPA: hypothetical protein VLW88_05590, partial [Hyphomicrobium sp.]|nr:hypothetical protein [Hyphomicrobium sp.]